MSVLTDKKDLTRWNRSGLSRFRYVDGNAISLLETLRQAMGEAFTEGGVNQWSALDTAIPEGVDENVAERQARWKEQYYDDRRDYAWEILRSYARASHVLTDHLDAYANESYLNTATQWDNLRRLVEMLDYHPAPPASASTPIALLAKEDKSGTVATGFAFKDKPEDGSAPSVFETLDDLEIDAELNKLKALDWNKSQEIFDYDPVTDTAVFPLSAPVEGVSVGTVGVLLVDVGGNDIGIAVSVTNVDDDAISLQSEAKPDAFPSVFKRHQVRLLLKPEHKEVPKLYGDNVLTLDTSAHGLTANDNSAIAWKTSGGEWRAARVTAVHGARIKVAGFVPGVGDELYAMVKGDAHTLSGVDDPAKRVVLPLERETEDVWNSALAIITASDVEEEKAKKEDGTELTAIYDYVDGDIYSSVFYVAESDSIAQVVVSNPQKLEFDGDPGNLATGNWVAVQIGVSISAAEIMTLTEADDSYELQLSLSPDDIDILFGDFEIDIRPKDYHINETPVFATDLASRSNSHSVIYLDGDEIPALLDVGRVLIVAGKDEALEVTVKAVSDEFNFIKVSPAIPGSELTADGTTDTYTRYDTIIYGNVVDAGHGETQKQSILGTGDATQSNQTFDFDAEEVSFVDDGKFPPGVRAALDVTVDSRTWQQVATLNDSSAEDAHYTVRMKEDGTLRFEFGDGFRGRRLPSGNNNVRIVHRKGNGLSGNVAAYSLVKEVKPHVLVDEVVQPIDAAGGNDMEAVATMRDNAPASVLTLSRAVSLADFTHLATSNSSVWQARAFRRNAGISRTEHIEVAVVPAGGGSLGSLQESLESYLAASALPGVKVTVVPYEGIVLDLKLIVRIKEDEYDSELVAKDVEDAVYDAFSLANSKLGEPLYRSQVIAVVEGVTGVANCVCNINPDGFHDEDGNVVLPRRVTFGKGDVIKRVTLEDDQVIFMKEGLSALEIVTQAFSV